MRELLINCREQIEYLAHYVEGINKVHGDAMQQIAAIDAELAKPEEKIVPLAMLREISKNIFTDENLIEFAKNYGYKVQCKICHSETKMAPDEKTATKLWNKRADHD